MGGEGRGFAGKVCKVRFDMRAHVRDLFFFVILLAGLVVVQKKLRSVTSGGGGGGRDRQACGSISINT